MEKNYKILLGLVALAVISTLFTGFLAFRGNSNEKVAIAENLGVAFNLANCYINDNKKATTTYTMIGAATTTMTCKTQFADLIDFNMQFAATSSASAGLVWNYQFSHNGIDFFDQDVSSADSNDDVSHTLVKATHKWSPGVTATSTKNVDIAPFASEYLRINLSMDTGNGTFWGIVKIREPIR